MTFISVMGPSPMATEFVRPSFASASGPHALQPTLEIESRAQLIYSYVFGKGWARVVRAVREGSREGFARLNGAGSGGDADESKSDDATESSDLGKRVS